MWKKFRREEFEPEKLPLNAVMVYMIILLIISVNTP